MYVMYTYMYVYIYIYIYYMYIYIYTYIYIYIYIYYNEYDGWGSRRPARGSPEEAMRAAAEEVMNFKQAI